MRYGMLGVSDINVATALLIIIAFVLGLFVYSMYLLRKGVGIRN
jgi:ABC-2 type transport system permease protein